MSELTDKEQLIQMSTKMDYMIESLSETKVGMKEMAVKMDDLGKDVNARFDEAESKNQVQFITRHEFDPIKRLVYGAVGIVLTGVALALVALVVANGGTVMLP